MHEGSLKTLCVLFLLFATECSSTCSRDIGQVSFQNQTQNVQYPKRIVDYYQEKRHSPSPYMYISKNVVTFYGNRTCDPSFTTKDIITGVNAFEKYFVQMQLDYHVKSIEDLRATYFSLYVSHTGLDPNPEDLVNGVVGASNECIMILLPNVMKFADTDPSTIIHELCHGLLHIYGPLYTLGEGVCEYTINHYMPSYPLMYDQTKELILSQPYLNIFGSKVQSTSLRYDTSAFWSFIAFSYGAPTVGMLTTHALSSSVSLDPWQTIATFLHTSETNLIINWVGQMIQVQFWRKIPAAYNMMRVKFAQGTPLHPINLVWNKPTTKEITHRVEKGGFEVLECDRNQTYVNTVQWQHLYIYQYSDQTASVVKTSSKYNQKKIVQKRLCVFILTSETP